MRIKRLLSAVIAAAIPLGMSLPSVAADKADDGLVLHYGFSDINNTGVVRDESGSGNDGTISGNALLEYGRMYFDGKDDYVTMPEGLLKDMDEVTIAVNMCPEFDTIHYFAWNFGNSSSSGYMFLNTSRPDAKLRFAITPSGAGSEQALASDNDIKKGTWSDVIVTIKGKKGVMYRDGVKVAENEFTMTPKDLGNTAQDWLGRSPYADALLNGYMDDFRVYNKALTEDEVKSLSAEYKNNLTNSFDAGMRESGLKNNVKESMKLPESIDGATIKWSSSDPAHLSDTGAVTRPAFGEYDAEVQLTAEITKDGNTRTETFDVVIPAEGGGVYGLNISSEKGADISDTMVGLFFEDINYAADGGLYAEMIENRSFESKYCDNKDFLPYDDPGWAWIAVDNGSLSFKTDTPLNEKNPHYMEVAASTGDSGFANAAYDGLTLKKDMVYHGSFYARSDSYTGGITVQAVKDNVVYGEAKVSGITNEWKKYEYTFTATNAARGADFIVTLDNAGTVDFDMVSLMPEDAVEGIFRKDLAEMLKAINPGFLRFPGGCVIEGYTLDNRYNWKDSVGPVEERPENWNRWDLHTEGYNHYNQTMGIGFYEYFKLCEYLGCEAIPVVNVGMSCQFQTNETVPIDSAEFKQYIQDALDLIEFANGDVSTEWGALRAEMGHPEPFNLTMLGIGNEQWNTEKNEFFKRYEAFEKAIHEKYPDMKLIGTAGPDVTSGNYKNAWSWIRENKAKNDNFVYAVDEHYYMTPDWFLQNTHFYDDYPRDVNVFAGEYASRTRNKPNDPEANTLYTALTEAAYFTGLERNADVVKMTCYAPLFARVGYTQWSPDLIWFDDASCYGSPSYYAQKLNGNNLGDYTLKYDIAEGSNTDGIFTSAAYDEDAKEVILKIVNTTEDTRAIDLKLNGFAGMGSAKVSLIKGDDPDISNSIDKPENVKILEGTANVSETYRAEPYSFAVVRIPVEKRAALADMLNKDKSVPFVDGVTDTLFMPDKPVTRAELAAMIARVSEGFDRNAVYPSTFTDVSTDAWYSNVVGFMQDKGVVEGYGDGTFNPDGIITNAEYTIILARLGYKGDVTVDGMPVDRDFAAFKLCELLGREPSQAELPFTDVPAAQQYRGYIAAACGL